MRWTERSIRFGGMADWARRIDVRLGLTLAGIFAPLVAVALLALYAFTADELLELAQLEVDERLSQLAAALHEQNPERQATLLALLGDQLARDSGGFVVRDASGRVIQSGGRSFPEQDGPRPSQGRFAAILITPSDDLHSRLRMSSGERVEVFIGSTEFIAERDDIQTGFWISLAMGVVLVAVASVPATRRALAPLRRATRAAEDMDAARLDARLPSRGTHDDVDRHSEAVNRLLDRIEAGLRRIESFSQDVAHELRTPINRILNSAEISLLKPGRPELDRAELESIRDSAGQMARMIEGLLLLARSEEGHLTLHCEQVELRKLCRVLDEMYRPACEERGLCLEVGPLSGEVHADTALLLRALGNLIDNAMAHTPAGGRIRLQATKGSPARGWVTIEVSDTGHGIPAGERARIFDRFVSLHAPGGAGGTGLGLPIARTLVRAHGGDVEVRPSNGPGACFVVRLPEAEPDASAVAAAGSRCGSARTADRTR